MKTQKGITLIALIITIIVMLILVGVSVSVALNTGLFKTAQGAAKNTEAEKVNETELSTGWITVINATTGNAEQVHIDSFSGKSVLDLRGDIGTKVAYSAGGVDDWKIWKKNKATGTITIVSEAIATETVSGCSTDEFLNSLEVKYTDPRYEKSIQSVKLITISDIIGTNPGEKRVLTTEELSLLEDFYGPIELGSNGIYRLDSTYFSDANPGREDAWMWNGYHWISLEDGTYFIEKRRSGRHVF